MKYMDRINKVFEVNQPDTPFTPEDARIFMSLLMSNDENLNMNINDLDKNSEIYKHFKPLIESFVSQIFLKRIEHFTTLKISLGALIMLLLFMESPENAVMCTYYLHTKLAPNTLITLDIFSKKAFPWGVFSPKQFNDIWDMQKVKEGDEVGQCIGAHDNLLDYLETWKNE